MSDLHPSQFEERLSINQKAALASWGLAGMASILLTLGVLPNKGSEWRMGCFASVWGISLLAKPIRRIVIDSERKRDDSRDISHKGWQEWLVNAMKPTAPLYSPAPKEAESDAIIPYDWRLLRDEIVQLLILGNSGAGKDCIARAIAAMFGDSQVLVLDHHNKGQPWRPLFVVDGMAAYLKQLELLLEELSQRKRDGKLGLPDRPPLIVYLNEWLGVVQNCTLHKLEIAEQFIQTMSSEARKYGILCIFLIQAENVDGIGLSDVGGLKDNFAIIRLCKSAKTYVKTHPDKVMRQYILSHKGFPCLVNDEIARHLTHDHHPRFGRGLAPLPLPPLHSQPLTIQIAVPIDDGTDAGSFQVVDGALLSVGASVHPINQPRTPPHPPSPPAPHPEVRDPKPTQDHTSDRTFLEQCWQQAFDDAEDGSAPGGDSPADGLNEGAGETAPDRTSDDEIDGLPAKVIRDQILELKAAGVTAEAEVIAAIWDIRKSGSNPRYDRARVRYRRVKDYFGL